MELRRAYDYASPTTLIAIIGDAIESVYPNASPLSITRRDTDCIISEAWDALIANVGLEDAIALAVSAGIDHTDLEALQS